MIFGIDNPEDMTPHERFQEVAAILAAGYLRMRKRFVHSPGLAAGFLEQSCNKDINSEGELLQDKSHATSSVYREKT